MPGSGWPALSSCCRASSPRPGPRRRGPRGSSSPIGCCVAIEDRPRLLERGLVVVGVHLVELPRVGVRDSPTAPGAMLQRCALLAGFMLLRRQLLFRLRLLDLAELDVDIGVLRREARVDVLQLRELVVAQVAGRSTNRSDSRPACPMRAATAARRRARGESAEGRVTGGEGEEQDEHEPHGYPVAHRARAL